MRSFHDLPLKRKLTIITLVIAGTALLLACAAFAWFEQSQFRQNNARDFAILADMFEDNVASGLAFNDPDSIEQTLSTLRANRHILAAGVYDKDGRILARYVREGLRDYAFPAATATGQISREGRLDTFKDIVLTGEQIGVFYVGADLQPLRDRAHRYVVIVALLLLGSSLVAFLLVARLQQLISQPIVDLAHIATRVAAGDFSRRATKRSRDEVGRLVDAFNEMLGHIQARNADLQQARDLLEKRVEERTAELNLERARFKFVFDSVPIGISAFVPGDSTKFLVNPAHERITGVRATDSHGPHAFAATSHPDDYRAQLARMEPFLRGEIDHYSIEKRFLHPDGRIVWASLTSRMFVDPSTGNKQAITTLVDFTEIKEAQEKAAREHARFKFIFESVPVGFSWMIRGQLATRIANPAHARITGIPVERCRELDLYQRATHPDDVDRQDAFQASLNAGDIDQYEIEKRYVHPDGSVRWALLTVKLYRDDQGAVQEIRTTVDITERKVAEEELRWKTAFLEALVESPLFGLRVVDPSGKMIFQNQRTVQLWNLPPDIKDDEDAQLHFLSQIERPASFLGRLQNIGRDETTKDEIKLRDGKVLDRYSAPVVGKDGRTYGRIFAYQDITERKDAEAKAAYEQDLLQTLLDKLPDTIYFKDRDSRFVRVSRSQAEHAWRFQRARHDRDQAAGGEAPLPAHADTVDATSQWLLGRTDLEVFGEQVARPSFEEEQTIVRTGMPVVGRIERVVLPTGETVWFLVNKMPWRDKDGNIIGTFGSSHNITPIKEAEAKLADTHKQLLEISRQAGMAEVATGVLHNVGNVLNSVNVSTTLIADHIRHSKIDKVAKTAELLASQQHDLVGFFTHDPRARKIPTFLQALGEHLGREQSGVLHEIDELRKNIEHIKEIVAMQQNYAKVSGVAETLPIVDLVEDALRMNSGALVRHDVALLRDFQSSPLVTVEKHKVLQILINLMRNAKYACDDSGRSDKVMTVRIATVDSRVKIDVIDNGVGIPPENLTRIFSHGFTTRKQGHGFGLHSCALAARELGGSLAAHSDGPGHGAVFTLELPHHSEIRAA